MKFEDFKIGDRVVAIKSDNDVSHKAFFQWEEGTVAIVEEDVIGVVFDKHNPYRHDLYRGDLCKEGHGFYFGNKGYPQAARFLAIQFVFDIDKYRSILEGGR